LVEEFTRLAALWEEWVAILRPFLPSPGVGYWFGFDPKQLFARPSEWLRVSVLNPA
jgi:hypothetical protein